MGETLTDNAGRVWSVQDGPANRRSYRTAEGFTIDLPAAMPERIVKRRLADLAPPPPPPPAPPQNEAR